MSARPFSRYRRSREFPSRWLLGEFHRHRRLILKEKQNTKRGDKKILGRVAFGWIGVIRILTAIHERKSLRKGRFRYSMWTHCSRVVVSKMGEKKAGCDLLAAGSNAELYLACGYLNFESRQHRHALFSRVLLHRDVTEFPPSFQSKSKRLTSANLT